MTLQDKATIVAMDMLRRQMHDSAAMAAANTQRTESDFAKQASDIASFMAKKGYGPPGKQFNSEDLGERPAPPPSTPQTPPTAPPAKGGAPAPAIATQPIVEELQGISAKIDQLPANIATAFGATRPIDPDQADAAHAASKSKFDTLGFGRDVGFGGSRVPRGLELGKGLGFGGSASPAQLRDKQAESPPRKPLTPTQRTAALKGNPLVSVMGQVVSKFAAIIGPAAVLGQVLNSNLSGFQVLNTSVKVLAGALAPVLLPVTVALSAGVLALSDVIMEHGLPIMGMWFDFVLGTAIPAIVFLVDTVDDAGDIVSDFATAVGEAIDWIKRQANSLNPFSDDDASSVRDSIVNRGPGEKGVQSGLTDTLRSLRLSMGPKASITGISDVGRQAQLAALNNDPIEARLQREQLKVLEKIEVGVNKRKPSARAYDPGNTGHGDYDRGLSGGSGGDYGGDE